VINILFPSAPALAEPCYRFQGAEGNIAWPMRDGSGLGPAGAWNFFWRLGFRPVRVTAESMTSPPADAVLVVVADGPIADAPREFVRRWHAGGNLVIAAGEPQAFAGLLPAGASLQRAIYPRAALGYALDPGTEIVAPPNWSFARWENSVASGRAHVAMIRGEKQTPSRAVIDPIDNAPAIVASDRFLYLNANPFAAFQAWLQGQEDLVPWLDWRPRLFWLDEHVAALWRIIAAQMPVLAALPRPGIAALGAMTVVLRHDLDSSRDTTYLEAELMRDFAASWAVLRDRNRAYWTERLNGLARIENCFHYNTIKRGPLIANELRRRAARFLGCVGPAAAESYVPARGEIAGAGLRRQVEWARAHGIGVATVHRHGLFLLYPELIDALRHTFVSLPEIKGGSSLFRAVVLRWGADRVDGNAGTFIDHPDAGFPFWLPFRLAHAGLGGELLRGWESTTIMDCEPELAQQLIDHRTPELPQRVVMLGFHPQHAQQSTLRVGGSAPDFMAVLDLVEARGIEVVNLRDLYARLDFAERG
jgi:hypothetical protein